MTAATQALSAALLHFVWQGTLVACLLWITLSMLRHRTANQRYAASCVALALMAALPVVTAWMLYGHSAVIPISSAMSTGTSLEVYAARIARQSPLLAWIAMWRQWALPAWSVGVLVFALRLVIGCRHVAALRRLGQAAEGQLAETVALLARRMKATRAIRVLISSMAEGPSVIGWLKPAILLPAATLAGLEPEQLEAVLAHEIAHIRRHDYLVNLGQTMVETLLFYHPAVWWASSRIRHERELCCDDAAVAVCGDAIAYARALTSLERLRVTPGVTTAPQLALGSAGGSLVYRIRRLAGVTQEIGPSKLPGIAALALGLAGFATTVHWAKAQQMAQQQPIAEEWGITVTSTGQLLHRNRVPYPEATYRDGIQGTVTLEATLDQSGNVTDARVLSGPPELRKPALQAVLQWQFADGRAGETEQVSVTFQQDARVQLQHNWQLTLNQVHRTDEFLKDELRAAQERGDPHEIEDLQGKISRANAVDAGVEEQAAQFEQVGHEQDDIDTSLEILRFNLLGLESKDHTQAVDSQIAQLKAAVATEEAKKTALQERMAQVIQTRQEQDQQNVAAHLAQLTRQLAEARKNLDENNPQSIAAVSQLEFLRNRAEGFSSVGARLVRIEIAGLPDSAQTALAAKLPVRLGYILSPESVQSVLEAIREFDPRLECRFTRTDTGDVTIRITGPEPGK
jgi:TonB family protein